LQLIFLGNLNSLLFRQRIEHLLDLVGSTKYTILDTGRLTKKDVIRFIYAALLAIFKTLSSTKPTCILLHGAYSPVFWPLLLLRRVRAVSILQGSELNVDFSGIRKHIIILILKNSDLVVCRNASQKSEAIRLCSVSSERCLIVNWGLNKELFNYPLKARSLEPVIISPRATQAEYNIQIIFEVISRLKREGHLLRFIYIKFNSKFEISETSVADLILDSPPQEELWNAIATADLCISVPDYDGLSNTVIESLALGVMPVYSALAAYDFLSQDKRLGIPLELGKSSIEKAEQLYKTLKNAFERIEVIRLDAEIRRDFAAKHFKKASGVEKIIEVLFAQQPL
jgi:glycosyltransferase involved in cell wall biosynthesis